MDLHGKPFIEHREKCFLMNLRLWLRHAEKFVFRIEVDPNKWITGTIAVHGNQMLRIQDLNFENIFLEIALNSQQAARRVRHRLLDCVSLFVILMNEFCCFVSVKLK